MASSTIPGTSFWNDSAWSEIGLASAKTIAGRSDAEPEVHGRDRDAAREAQPRCEHAHDRVEDQRDHRGDEEDEQHRPGGPGDHPQPEDRRAAARRAGPSAGRRPAGRAGHGAVGGASGPRRLLVRCLPSSLTSALRALGSPSTPTADGLRPSRRRSILFVGDVVGGVGRRTLRGAAARAARALRADFVVVNGENSAGGLGITPKIADEFFAAGVDVITLGNHTYRHREIWPYLDEHERDPAPRELPALASPATARASSSATASRSASSTSQGTCSCRPGSPRSPRSSARSTQLEATPTTCSSTCTPRRRARRSAMGWYLDGRVTAVVGTHTHVPTADARVLPGRHGVHHRRRDDRRRATASSA